MFRLFSNTTLPTALCLGVTLALTGVSLSASAAPARKALIIANARYPEVSKDNMFDSLAAPEYDAALMRDTLRGQGFQVPGSQVLLNKNRRTIKDAVKRFVRNLNPDDIAMIYFSGHGTALETEGGVHNYLLPSGQGFASRADVIHEAINAKWLLDSMGDKLTEGIAILVLDACRNSPAPLKGMGAQPLTSMEKENALVVYGTRQGWAAIDNREGGPSIFTEHFAKNLTKFAHQPISTTLNVTRGDVIDDSQKRYGKDNKQVPWEDNGLRGDTPFCISSNGCQHSNPADKQALAAKDEALAAKDEAINAQQAEIEALKQQLAQQQANPAFRPSTSHQPLALFQDRLASGGKGPVMVSIPTGEFRMGDIQGKGHSDEKPVHKVKVPAFAMGQFEVTNAQYVTFLNAAGKRGPSGQPWFETQKEDSRSKIIGQPGSFSVESGYAQHPAINISWYGAQAYVAWLSQQTGQTYRLPTESEWEYAARAGTETAYWWGNQAPVCDANARNGAVFYKCKGNTRPVDSFQANPFKLHHILGNAWEWVEDCYRKNYNRHTESAKAARCEAGSSYRVLRGGGWNVDPEDLRAAFRNGNQPGSRGSSVGFRVVRSAP
ncbi:MAG: SUMF1/EgtB/PvdO family nonheme iron enzyme [Marinobacterium sp.]|nr:SUMF1/EgtB/PvdO family nonheme iron enzyme [Marinobacterium sp.]